MSYRTSLSRIYNMQVYAEQTTWSGKVKGLRLYCLQAKRIACQQFHCCCCSVAKSCPTLCNPVDCSMPGFPVLHYLLEFAQCHVNSDSDAIQPSHPLMPPSPFVFSFIIAGWGPGPFGNRQRAKYLRYHGQCQLDAYICYPCSSSNTGQSRYCIHGGFV